MTVSPLITIFLAVNVYAKVNCVDFTPPGKRITAGMETSPVTTYLAVWANTASRDILDSRTYVCQNVAPTFCSWITVITQNGARVTLCHMNSLR